MIFKNAKNIPLNQSTGTLPDVSGAMLNWFQPTTFGVVTKSVVNYQDVEEMVEFTYQAVVQPLSKRRLMMKPEGQQAWNWLWIHAEPALILAPDQIIVYQGTQYRVMNLAEYDKYGYREYEIVEDYTGSGPTAVTP